LQASLPLTSSVLKIKGKRLVLEKENNEAKSSDKNKQKDQQTWEASICSTALCNYLNVKLSLIKTNFFIQQSILMPEVIEIILKGYKDNKMSAGNIKPVIDNRFKELQKKSVNINARIKKYNEIWGKGELKIDEIKLNNIDKFINKIINNEKNEAEKAKKELEKKIADLKDNEKEIEKIKKNANIAKVKSAKEITLKYQESIKKEDTLNDLTNEVKKVNKLIKSFIETNKQETMKKYIEKHKDVINKSLTSGEDILNLENEVSSLNSEISQSLSDLEKKESSLEKLIQDILNKPEETPDTLQDEENKEDKENKKDKELKYIKNK